MIKRLITLLAFLLPLFALAQRTFTFTIVNAISGKPMSKKWGTIIKNNEEYIDFTSSDVSGVYTFTDRKYDSTATYQFEILNSWNNSVQTGRYDITGVKNSPVILKLAATNYPVAYTCGTLMYPRYYAREAFFLDDLPAKIQSKIRTYLTDRVGEDFYKKLILNGGQWVNLKKFYSLNPKIDPKKFRAPNYSLCFMVWDSVKHKTLYNFSLNLDERGSLMGIIELPDIKHHPEKSIIIDSAASNLVARQYSFTSEGEIMYDPKSGSIIREYKNYKKGEGKYTVVDHLWIDVHTGKVADRRSTNEVIVY
ncbi:hypothetical protein KXD93_26975 [Mucilaginibacter sp. BJC16-A38]|uniref:hypothetical protein n=1 Tax=Mucilaginibacter phenanthrenivorans TaxID=1234842 RepID=UPI00215781AF|nr:hypothetical protein [Mucilaginibacter phenanthrenivorans]MCR8561326.1 hypothetical protein [Mucilaginibacter phenanthrenivorans]